MPASLRRVAAGFGAFRHGGPLALVLAAGVAGGVLRLAGLGRDAGPVLPGGPSLGAALAEVAASALLAMAVVVALTLVAARQARAREALGPRIVPGMLWGVATAECVLAVNTLLFRAWPVGRSGTEGILLGGGLALAAALAGQAAAFLVLPAIVRRPGMGAFRDGFGAARRAARDVLSQACATFLLTLAVLLGLVLAVSDVSASAAASGDLASFRWVSIAAVVLPSVAQAALLLGIAAGQLRLYDELHAGPPGASAPDAAATA